MRWKVELRQYCYGNEFYKEKFYVAHDALSRVYCGGTTANALYRTTRRITRMHQYVCMRSQFTVHVCPKLA